MVTKHKRAANKALGQKLTQQKKEKQRKLKDAPCSIDESILLQPSKHCCNCRRSRVEGITDVPPLFLYKVNSKQLKKRNKRKFCFVDSEILRVNTDCFLCRDCHKYIFSSKDDLNEMTDDEKASYTWPVFIWNCLSTRNEDDDLTHHAF